MELLDLQWAMIDYIHLRGVWVGRGEPGDLDRATEAWRSLECAWARFQAVGV